MARKRIKATMDIEPDRLIADLRWPAGDTTFVHTIIFRLNPNDPNADLPTSWIGTHYGGVYSRFGAQYSSVSIVMSAVGADLVAYLTVVNPEAVPAGLWTWSARQFNGTDAGVTHFGPANVEVISLV